MCKETARYCIEVSSNRGNFTRKWLKPFHFFVSGEWNEVYEWNEVFPAAKKEKNQAPVGDRKLLASKMWCLKIVFK